MAKPLLLMVQFSSVALSCMILCDPMDCSTLGLPVHHQFPEFTQTHVHLVGDAIQPSHPLSSPSPPAFILSQHQGLFKGVSSSHQVAKVLKLCKASASALPMNIQDRFPLGWTGWISLLFKGLSRVFSNTTVQKYQFFSTQLSLLSNSHIHTWLLEKLRAPRILFNSVSSLNSQWAFCFVSLLWKLKAVGICALQKGIKQAFNGKGGQVCTHVCVHL